jgi:hypothetical protein|tara:strand:+ start:680 stop:952 length:273 start_codon:yes stop_codon:yes gene_type:complete
MKMDFIVRVSDRDMKVLENDLLDVNDWIQKAVAGKINNCKKRMVGEWQQRLFNDPNVDSIPATSDALIDMVVQRADYKNRATREAEAQER